jgi:predicted nuclease of restriction endonuclease-like (RecB) superfamily
MRTVLTRSLFEICAGQRRLQNIHADQPGNLNRRWHRRVMENYIQSKFAQASLHSDFHHSTIKVHQPIKKQYQNDFCSGILLDGEAT